MARVMLQQDLEGSRRPPETVRRCVKKDQGNPRGLPATGAPFPAKGGVEVRHAGGGLQQERASPGRLPYRHGDGPAKEFLRDGTCISVVLQQEMPATGQRRYLKADDSE
ncbi:hypothetical protein PAXRUDRAFT_28949 [Paxillus rubicundulus Ve08.2h10]|uniref:Uncharacterized protein n=1 Tax=Paxillus rubicundulus Ve08.2h10 TaxID=930991 RepID=A0A0D0BZT5_9AGAM|nr:hypothetical protein PAXRUDRAFT_28949 [Paxillus rubicundulus Ve08.2h10]